MSLESYFDQIKTYMKKNINMNGVTNIYKISYNAINNKDRPNY